MSCHLLYKDTHKTRNHAPSVNGGVGELNFESIELLALTAIIEPASIAYERPTSFSSVTCRKCDGEIEV
jgi:hypothetical protein